MRRLAIINQKGGVGKTTTAANLSAALARLGHRVLMIDLDPQAHLSLHYGVAIRDDEPGVYTVLAEDEPIRDAIRRVDDRLALLPAQIDLAAAEVELAGVVGREVILREALDAVEDDYDFAVLDCPPSLGVLTLNGLSAANEVVVPLQPHFLALQGLGKLFQTVSLVSQRINPEVRVTGVVICMHEQGTRLAGEVLDDLRSFLTSAEGTAQPWSDARIFGTVIRRNIRLAECPSHGRSIFDYAPQCNGADDYMSLAREFTGAVDVIDECDGTPEASYVDAARHVSSDRMEIGHAEVAADVPGPVASHASIDAAVEPAVDRVHESTPVLTDPPAGATHASPTRVDARPPSEDTPVLREPSPVPVQEPLTHHRWLPPGTERVELELGAGWTPRFEALREEPRERATWNVEIPAATDRRSTADGGNDRDARSDGDAASRDAYASVSHR